MTRWGRLGQGSGFVSASTLKYHWTSEWRSEGGSGFIESRAHGSAESGKHFLSLSPLVSHQDVDRKSHEIK